jgi:hypothetical protein
MSEQTIGLSRSVDARATLPWLVAAAVYLLLMALGSRLIADPDIYWHIALGRLILDQHALPVTDPFSATMHGAPWVDYEWLSEVGYTLTYRLGGWVAVAALTAGAAALALGLLARYLLDYWRPVPVTIAVLAALTLTAPHIVARPHMLALPLLVIWIAELIRAVDDERPPSWRLLPVMTLWVNLHGGFLFGLAMIGPIAAEAIWRAPAEERWRSAKNWIAFGALAFAAACINPYGPEMLVVNVRILLLGQALPAIIEWRPEDFSHLGAYEIMILAAAGFALLRGVRLPPFRILILLGVLHLSLSQSRHAELLGMLAPLFVARPLAAQFAALAADKSGAAGLRPPGLFLAANTLMVAIIGGALGAIGHVVPAANITPAAAVSALAKEDHGPILNSYEFGGYLDFVGVPPFIDGRTDLYGEQLMLRYYRGVMLEDLPDFLKLLDDYKIETALLIPATPVVALLDRLPEWRRVYADDIAVIYTRHHAAAK